MSKSYRLWDHKEWESAGLDSILYNGEWEYCNQDDDYGDSLCGDCWIADDERRVIIYSSFGNDHSPGCSHATYAEVYEPGEEEEYQAEVERLESLPEYTEEYLARGEEEEGDCDEGDCDEEDSELPY